MIMRPSFNTTGPCIPSEHYMLPPGERLGRVLELVEAGKYFTLHAGRQTGKTTSARWLVKHLNEGERFHAIWVDVQTARDDPNPASAFETLFDELDLAVQRALPQLGLPPERDRWLVRPTTALLHYLMDLSARCPRPLVLMIDEADALVGQTMVSFLTQLRCGYIDRSSTPFPSSVALVGMRQVCDYVLSHEEREKVRWLGTTSPFNITAEAATLAAFTPEQVASLLGQHMEATGQRFEPEAVALLWELSQGHPWLVNAMADQIVDRDVRDRSMAITAAHVEAAVGGWCGSTGLGVGRWISWWSGATSGTRSR